MNGRTVPWRKRPTQDIQDTFADAIELKLYLLQEIGPTSFVFKDENENKFKVSIGHEISCSCSPHRKDHCIHTLYVCFKIFKLNQDNPLVWQASYIDSEIADIMRSRFNPSTSQKPKRTNFLKKSTNPMMPSKDKGGKNRQALGEDDMCPICHEDLSEEEGTTFCKKGCGNNFHIKCSLIWAEHRHKIGDAISCPMCRCDWGARAYETLVKEFQDFESRLILHKGHKCGGCKGTKPKAIKGKLFHCVYCDNFELCEKCFQNFEHFEHHRYLVKENINSEWRPAQNRDKTLINPHTKNSLDVFNEIMGYGNFNMNSQMGLMNNLRGFNRPGENMYEGDSPENFILSCFPDANSDFEAALSGKPNNLAIIGHDVKKNCSYCHTDKMDVSKLKRLNCGHVMHGHCILEMVSNKNFRCPDDSVEFLKGYKNACCPRENPVVAVPSQNTPQKVAVAAQNANKALKKPFEEQKINLNKNNKMKLGPLELDIKGKAVSGSNDANMESPGMVDMGDLYKPKPSSILMKNMMKKPPTHGKTLMKANTREVTLPPLFEIQGTNLNNNGNNNNATAEQQQQQPAPKSVGKVIKKPLMQIQQNSSNSMSERPSPLSVNNFRIVPSSLKVQPRKTRKSTNPASLKSIPKSREEEVNVVMSKSSERNYAVSAQNVEQNEDYENNLTDYEEVGNENY